jgi:hypothetical protein
VFFAQINGMIGGQGRAGGIGRKEEGGAYYLSGPCTARTPWMTVPFGVGAPVFPRPAQASERFRLGRVSLQRLPALIASAIAAMLVAVASSLVGQWGALIGAALASLIAGTASAIFDHVIRRGGKVVAGRVRRSGGPLAPVEVVPGKRPWPKLAGYGLGSAAIIAVLTIGGITAVEAIAVKPVAAVVKNEPGHGLSLTGGPVSTPAPASPSPTSPAQTPADSPMESSPASLPPSPPSSVPPSSVPPSPVPTTESPPPAPSPARSAPAPVPAAS